MAFTQDLKHNCVPESLDNELGVGVYKFAGSDLWYRGCNGCQEHCQLGACVYSIDNLYRPTIAGKVIKHYLDKNKELQYAGKYFSRKEALDAAERILCFCDYYHSKQR